MSMDEGGAQRSLEEFQTRRAYGYRVKDFLARDMKMQEPMLTLFEDVMLSWAKYQSAYHAERLYSGNPKATPEILAFVKLTLDSLSEGWRTAHTSSHRMRSPYPAMATTPAPNNGAGYRRRR